MHIGKNFSFQEVVFWTRRDLGTLIFIASIPVTLYELLDWKWLAVPWLPIALLGTAVAFIVGFKNNASYDRMWEARKAWGGIVNTSRSWAIMCKDFITHKHTSEKLKDEDLQFEKEILMNRHFAWLTALRFQLREKRNWEAIYKKHNQEYQNKWFRVEEQNEKLEDHLKKYLSVDEFEAVMSKTNKAAYLLSLQSAHLKKLHDKGLIEDFRHMELEKQLVELYNQQGVCERIKNFPYPRQYATVNLYFVRIFVALVPMGMLQEFDKLGEHYVWLSIPFSTLSTWIFTTMEKIGEATESPFEGSANDIPITTMSRAIEIDLREIMHMNNIPETLKPVNNIST